MLAGAPSARPRDRSAVPSSGARHRRSAGIATVSYDVAFGLDDRTMLLPAEGIEGRYTHPR